LHRHAAAAGTKRPRNTRAPAPAPATADRGGKKYGSGGLIQGKKYMLSLTWNAPLEAFTAPEQFFHGVGVDGVYLHFHKANQFLGMEALPTFICNDVIKQPDIDGDIARYRAHLTEIFA
jgi:modulator of drug activity B